MGRDMEGERWGVDGRKERKGWKGMGEEGGREGKGGSAALHKHYCLNVVSISCSLVLCTFLHSIVN